MRVLVTRPQGDAERTAARLAARGHEAVVAPATALVPTGAAAPEGPFAGLVLTSAHAVPFCAGLSPDLEVFAVGPRTAAAAREAGFATVHEGSGDAAGLCALVRRRLPPGAALLHATGRDRKPEPGRSLRADGHPVAVFECYRAEALPALADTALSQLRAGRIGAALHYSRRSAGLVRDRCAAAGLAEPFRALVHLCLSADVAAALPGHAVRIAAQPREEALLALLDGL